MPLNLIILKSLIYFLNFHIYNKFLLLFHIKNHFLIINYLIIHFYHFENLILVLQFLQKTSLNYYIKIIPFLLN